MATVPTPTSFYPNQGSAADNYLKHKQPGSYPNEGSRRWGRAPAAPTGGVITPPSDEPDDTWTRQGLIDWINDWLGFDLPNEFYDAFSDEELLVLITLLTNEDTGAGAGAESASATPTASWTKSDIAGWLSDRGVNVGRLSKTTKTKMLKQVSILTGELP